MKSQVIIRIVDGLCTSVFTDTDLDITLIYQDHQSVPEYGIVSPEVTDMSQVSQEIKDQINRIKK